MDQRTEQWHAVRSNCILHFASDVAHVRFIFAIVFDELAVKRASECNEVPDWILEVTVHDQVSGNDAALAHP